MERLESLLVSGDRLFRLVSYFDESEKLKLLVDRYVDLSGVPCLKQSGQHDLVLSPDVLDNLLIVSVKGVILLSVADGNGSVSKDAIGVYSDDEWTCFYLKADYKLIIHVQPNNAAYNFANYEHKPLTRTNIMDELKKLEDSGKHFNDKLAEMMSEIDKINEDMLKMELPK